MSERVTPLTPSIREKKRPRIDDNARDKEHKISHADFLTLPSELQDVDFTKRITWGKYHPYTDKPIPLTPIGTKPKASTSQQEQKQPPLCFHINGSDGRARACSLHLLHGLVETPIFMPVGTKGTLKGVTTEEIMLDDALNCPIILANTYHMALQPTTTILKQMGGLHEFMNWNRDMLTDSGGFQMVSLLKLAEITEDGVTFENPFLSSTKLKPANDDNKSGCGNRNNNDNVNNNDQSNGNETDGGVTDKSYKSRTKKPGEQEAESAEAKGSADTNERMLLRPEDSIEHQNNIGSDICMALDDVVSSVAADDDRFKEATYRTLRWLDRCYESHKIPEKQNLFPIVQGGLDTSIGGLREHCLAGFSES